MSRRWIKWILALAVIALTVFIGLRMIHDYSRARDTQMFGTLVNRVETDQPLVALTFDDGPKTENTIALLETLAHGDVTATFFLIGKEVSARPDAARAIMDAGHEIGNHSWDHPRMMFMTETEVRAQLDRTDAAIRAIGYNETLHFRPPFGRKFVVLPWVLAAEDRTTVMWSVEPETVLGFDATPADLAAHVINSTQAGDIVLLHGMNRGNQSTRDALPLMIEGLRERGFGFVTVSDLLALQTSP